jgi:hypothetical protein
MRRVLTKLGLSLGTLLITLLLLEVGIRIYEKTKEPPPPSTQDALMGEEDGPPLHIPLDSPVLYGLNPEHPEVNALGHRDDEISEAKPEGTFRVLVLGDSIALSFSTAL